MRVAQEMRRGIILLELWLFYKYFYRFNVVVKNTFTVMNELEFLI